jgi:hypothetical protein
MPKPTGMSECSVTKAAGVTESSVATAASSMTHAARERRRIG